MPCAIAVARRHPRGEPRSPECVADRSGLLHLVSSGYLPLEGATSTVASGDRAQAVARAQHWAGEGGSGWYTLPTRGSPIAPIAPATATFSSDSTLNCGPP